MPAISSRTRRSLRGGLLLAALAASLLAVAFPGASWAAVGDLTLASTQSMPSRGEQVVVSPDGSYLAVAAANMSDDLVVLDRNADGSLQAAIDGLHASFCIAGDVAVSPDGRSIYLACAFADQLAHVRRNLDGTFQASTTIATGATPFGVAVSPDGLQVYVTNNSDDTLYRYTRSTATGALTLAGSSMTSAGPSRLAISPDGTSVYVTAMDASANRVDAFARAGSGVLTSIGSVATDTRPMDVAVAADGSQVFTANSTGASVTAFDRAGDGTLSGRVDHDVTGSPNGVDVSPDGHGVYVAAGALATLRRASDGTLAAPTYTTETGFYDVVVADDETVYAVNTSALVYDRELPVDLAASITGPASADQGDTLAYDLTVDSAGPGATADARIDLALPSGTSFDAGGSDPACSATAGGASCSIGALAVAGSATVTVAVRFDDAGTPSLTATAAASESDLEPLDDSAAIAVTVTATAAPPPPPPTPPTTTPPTTTQPPPTTTTQPREQAPDDTTPPATTSDTPCPAGTSAGVSCTPLDGGGLRIVGTSGADRLVGTSAADKLFGGAGNDVLVGAGGVDTLYGGRGNDILLGGQGDDHVDGGPGRDSARGNAGDDRVVGGDGNDVLRGDDGDDVLVAGLGHDRVFGAAGDDRLVGGPGNDRLVPGTGVDHSYGGSGADRILSADRVRDGMLSCGPGRDTFTFDLVDVLVGCEFA